MAELDLRARILGRLSVARRREEAVLRMQRRTVPHPPSTDPQPAGTAAPADR